jgi:hypothetical protein
MRYKYMIFPCRFCGPIPEAPKAGKPDNDVDELYQITCTCEQAAPQWAASPLDAIHLWNKTMAG